MRRQPKLPSTTTAMTRISQRRRQKVATNSRASIGCSPLTAAR
jgi:hypothetical protein